MLNVRNRFTFLESCNYLDTASAGLTAPGVGASVAYYLDVVKGRGILGREEWRAKSDELRARLARLLNAPVGDISYFSNTSEGINLFAHSLEWRAGDNVVVAADEYPAVLQAWHVAARQGVDVVQMAVTDESQREDLLLGAMNARTRVLAVSHVNWVTGTLVDISRMGRACRANGTLLVVDGVQALGAVPVDLADVDVYSAATFKWLLSGFGFSVFAASENARAKLQPAFRGAMNARDPSVTPTELQYGHPNYSGIYALAAAIDFFDECGWDAVFAKVRTLADRLAAGLHAQGRQVSAPKGKTAGIVSFAAAQPDKLTRELSARSIQVTGRGAALRVSPHFYNDAADIDGFLAALSSLH